MFEGLSDRSWAVVTLARREAVRRRAPLVLPEHLLQGVIEEGGPDGAGLLLRLGVTAGVARPRTLDPFSRVRDGPGSLARFSVGTEDVLDLAREYAGYTRSAKVEPLHILAAIAVARSSDAGVLEDTTIGDSGVDAEGLVQAVFREFHERQSPAERSMLRAAAILMAHPGGKRLERLVRRLVRLHEHDLAKEDFEAAVILRGVLLNLAEDERKPLREWVAHARSQLEEQAELHDMSDDPLDTADEEE